MIDTLKLKETFEANGFNNAQACSLSHAMNDLSKNQTDLATKEELHQVRNELKSDIKEVRDEIKDLRTQTNHLLTALENSEQILLEKWKILKIGLLIN